MNKQALTEALAEYERTLDVKRFYDFEDMKVEAVHALAAAARLVERLLPGECGSCPPMNHQLPPNERPFCICATCHGTGQVWDEGIVEAVADVLIERRVTHKDQLRTFTDAVATCREDARAVLSALVELLTEKAGVADRPVLDSIEGVDPSEYSIELSTQPSRLPE